MHWRRILLPGLACGLLLIGGVLWYADAVWLPTRGRLWLTQQLAARLKTDVTLQEISAHPLHGVVLTDLRITELATHRLLLRVASAQGWFNPWPLLVHRRVEFRAQLRVEDPGPAVVDVTGHYGLRDGACTIDARTQPVAIERLGPGSRLWLPAEVRAGTTVVGVHVEQSPGQPPQLTGTADVTDARIEHAPYRARGRLHLAGAFRRDGGTWHWQLAAQPSDVTVEGAPRLGVITHVDGNLRIDDWDLPQIDLTGAAGELRLHLTGSATNLREPHVNVTVTAQGPVGALQPLAPSWPADLQLTGQTQLTVEAQGPLAPQPLLQWTARGTLTDGTLQTGRWPHPITALQAQAHCDGRQQQCAIDALTGVTWDAPFHLTGTVGLRDPFPATIDLTVKASLTQLTPWMPAALKTLAWSGDAIITSRLEGPALELSLTRIEAVVREGGAQLPAPWSTLRRINGRLVYEEETLVTPGLRFEYAGEEYTLTGTMQRLRLAEEPELSLHLAGPRLTANLDGRIDTHDLHVHVFEARYLGSTVRILGDLLNWQRPRGHLFVKSTLELADLPTLPLPPAWKDALTAQAVTGTVKWEGTFEGPLGDAWSTGRLDAKATSPQCTVGRVTLQQLAAEAHLEDGQLHVPVCTAVYAGGQVQGRGHADLRRPSPPFDLQLSAVDVDLAQALAPWHPPQPIVGTLQTSWALVGEGVRWDRLHGTGTVQAQGENLGTVPVVHRLLGGLGGIVADYLRVGQLRQVTFKEAAGRFTIADGRAGTQDLTFRSDTMGCLAEGTIGCDQRLDVLVMPSVTQAIIQQSPVVGQRAARVARVDTLALGRVRITGTLEEPVFTPQLAPVAELLQQLVPDQVRDVLRGVQDILRR